MASEYWGLNRGQTEFQVTQGTATGNTDVEVRVDLTKSLDKNDVLVKLQEICNVILKGNWPPA